MEQKAAKPGQPHCPLGLLDCPCQVTVTELRQELETLRIDAGTDRLTGLGNYRRFNEALVQEMARTRRNGQPMALIIADLDYFKRINDTYGHAIGNEALQHVARLWLSNSRSLDIVCRYGGEEIVFVLPDTNLPAAIHMAERHRWLLEQTPLASSDGPIRLSASFGIAIYPAASDTSPEQLIAEADHWLYQAKANGRNRVGHPEPTEVSESTGLTRAERAALFAPLADSRQNDQ